MPELNFNNSLTFFEKLNLQKYIFLMTRFVNISLMLNQDIYHKPPSTSRPMATETSFQFLYCEHFLRL